MSDNEKLSQLRIWCVREMAKYDDKRIILHRIKGQDSKIFTEVNAKYLQASLTIHKIDELLEDK